MPTSPCLPGLLVALWLPSYPAFFVLLLGYALYLGEAAALHLYRYLTDASLALTSAYPMGEDRI